MGGRERWGGEGAGGQRGMKYIFMQKKALGKGRISEVFLLLHLCSAKLEVPFQTERKAEASISCYIPERKKLPKSS